MEGQGEHRVLPVPDTEEDQKENSPNGEDDAQKLVAISTTCNSCKKSDGRIK